MLISLIKRFTDLLSWDTDFHVHCTVLIWCWALPTVWEIDHPPYVSDLAPRDFHVSCLEGEFVRTFFTCNEDIKCATIICLMLQEHILCFWDEQTYHLLCVTGASTTKSTMLKNSIAMTNFIVFCQFPLLKSYLWFMGTVTFWSTTIMAVQLSLLNC
jgi:hypothetical protein